MNERIKKLRKELGLTQQEFANRIGSVQNTITGYETGRRIPSSQVIALICREFSVNETWLRTGQGDMFVQKSRSDEISDFIGDVLSGEPDFRRLFISLLARMTTEEWKLLERKALELVATVQSIPVVDANIAITTPTSDANGGELAEPDLAAEIAELKRQNQEKDKQLQKLAAEVAALKEEDVGMEAAAELSAWPSVSAGSHSPVERAKK